MPFVGIFYFDRILDPPEWEAPLLAKPPSTYTYDLQDEVCLKLKVLTRAPTTRKTLKITQSNRNIKLKRHFCRYFFDNDDLDLFLPREVLATNCF